MYVLNFYIMIKRLSRSSKIIIIYQVLNKIKATSRILKGKAHSNKTQARMKSMNMDIWLIGTPNELLKRSFCTHIKFKKKKVVAQSSVLGGRSI